MSQILITQYLAQLDVLKKVSGTERESVVREAFKDLLKGWGKQHDLVFIPEYKLEAPNRETRFVDGALLYELRVPFGYWEAKDAADNLDAEIALKFKRGYPQDNIIFEDSVQAVLIQNRHEIMRCQVTEVAQLERLLSLFFAYERQEIADFRQAIAQFKLDLPSVLIALRGMIEQAHSSNAAFGTAAQQFLDHAQTSISPNLTAAEVREMLIQHILTEEIFSTIFYDGDFHRKNNVATELYRLEETFFTGGLKKSTLKGLEPYYAAIRAAAAQIGNHSEKQTFLKVIYENFYKVYNAKAADRLGVVYTPNEIVRFMIEGADWLCERHFGRTLIDPDVEILDPAAGTGTFICELLEYFRGQPAKLKRKYTEELHANEVAILPYYVANLNIEATYAAITGEYLDFPNLCFVDTLDNVGLHTQSQYTTGDMFGGISAENKARIKRQNLRTISVIIGNPPYNANQLNANESNKNREYPVIDERIKVTYGAASTAQAKNKGFDMYARFFRWASDRLDTNGVLAFVTNRSFVDARTFDGFRKVVTQEFTEIWIVDLKGNARTSGECRRQEGGNIFYDQIRVGIAVWFCIKKQDVNGCRIFYESVRDYAKADEKREFLIAKRFRERSFEQIRPDAQHNWLHQTNNDFTTLLPLISKDTKADRTDPKEQAIFKIFSMGVTTNRDDWLYDKLHYHLENKIRWFISVYNSELQRVGGQTLNPDQLDCSIKWSRALLRALQKRTKYEFDSSLVRSCLYRPFVQECLYFAPGLNEYMYDLPAIFPTQNINNLSINISVARDFRALASNQLVDLHFVGDTMLVPLRRFDVEGTSHDNITDWGLNQFTTHYHPGRGSKTKSITKEAIFHYVYAVLHDPLYREQYAHNLQREFPRIPLYGDTAAVFWQWANWGKALLGLHIGYAQVPPFTLTRVDIPDNDAQAAGQAPKCLLKADKVAGHIVIDSVTTLTGVPPEAWSYQLGNRCAIEWILDQYKEKRPKDPNIRAQFNTYKFINHKERVIELLRHVTTVSLETMRIVQAMTTSLR